MLRGLKYNLKFYARHAKLFWRRTRKPTMVEEGGRENTLPVWGPRSNLTHTKREGHRIGIYLSDKAHRYVIGFTS